MDGKYYKSKQSTLVLAMEIRGGMCVDNESCTCTKARGRDGKYKSKQSTLVLATGIWNERYVKNDVIQRQ